MRIKSVRSRAIDVGFQRQALQTQRVASPMSRWPEYADRRASWMWPSKKAFVRIEAEDGNVGWACTNGGEVAAMIVAEHLSRLVEGRLLEDLAELWDQMFCSLLPNDRSGFAMMAIAGVDIALWDLKAKEAGRPLVDLLGGTRQTTLSVYATTSEPERLAGEAWWGLKAAMPFGAEAGLDGLKQNVDLMRRFRDAAGPERRIMLDAFMAWDADYTLRFAEAARDLDIFWIEDPLPPTDLVGLRKIRKEAGDGVTLALGNFCFNRWDCQHLIDEGLVDILQPDVAWAGGISECSRILELAATANVPVILHNTLEQPWALALAAARQTDAVVEFVDRGVQSELYTLMGEAARATAGRVAVPRAITANTPPAHVCDCFARLAGNNRRESVDS